MIECDLPPAAPPEYRRDPITGLWTIIASERAARPLPTNQNQSVKQAPADCPFCPGNEVQTPPAVLTFPNAAPTSAWQIRVFPNRYPAVRRMENVDELLNAHVVESPFATRFGHGEHEVVVERREHVPTLGDLPPIAWESLLECYRSRVRALSAVPGVAYVSVFRNNGPAAGASQLHAHSQILAAAEVPPWVKLEYDSCRRHFAQMRENVFDRVIANERAARIRIVDDGDGATAYCPFASRFPFETWVVPTSGGRFAEASDQELAAVAAGLRRAVAAVEAVVADAAYNFYLHDVPVDCPSDGYRWHIEIAGRAIGIAGFELGGGGFVNPYPPEWSAARLVRSLANP